MAGAEERSFPAAPVSYGANRVIASPFQFSLTDDDNLQIVSANSLAGVVLTIQGRRLSTAGRIEEFSFTHAPNTDRSSRTENFKLGAGALLNLVIYASSGTPMIGQTYVSARLIRGLTGGLILLGGLLGGYVTAAQPLAYPGSPIESSLAAGGYIRRVLGTDPAPGAQINETVPVGARWELLAFSAVLTTTGAGVGRNPRLQFTIANQPVCETAQFVPVPPASSYSLYWAQGLPLVNVAPNSPPQAGAPTNLPLPAGAQLTTAVVSFDVGDDWGAPGYVVREWLEVQV